MDLYRRETTIPASQGVSDSWADQPAGTHVTGAWLEVPTEADPNVVSFSPANIRGDGMVLPGADEAFAWSLFNSTDVPVTVVVHWQAETGTETDA